MIPYLGGRRRLGRSVSFNLPRRLEAQMAPVEKPCADDSFPVGEPIPGSEPPRVAGTREPGDALVRDASTRAFTRHVWPGRARGHHAIASLDSLIRHVEERSRATSQSPDEAAAVIVEDFERAAATLNARVAPLVPGCGLLVAVTGLLLRAEPSSDGSAEFFFGLSVLFAVGGFSFLTRAIFVYAGRRHIGRSPIVDDIAYARDCLITKHVNAHRGGWLAGLALPA
jgi:hypothetical protein